jgi:hypothetical protein
MRNLYSMALGGAVAIAILSMVGNYTQHAKIIQLYEEAEALHNEKAACYAEIAHLTSKTGRRK